MRKILFRGKDVRNGEWREGGFLYDSMSPYAHIYTYTTNPKVYPTDRMTFGQYIDKLDSNGTKIFEGDIVRNPDGEIGEIMWYGKYGSFVIIRHDPPWPKSNIGFLYDKDFLDIEVIGNIFDNPELLEGDQCFENT